MTKQETQEQREDRIIDLAAESVFYKNEDGMFRIDYTCQVAEEDDGNGDGAWFQVSDENSGEEYKIEACDVKDTDVFFTTNEVVVGSPKPSIDEVVSALRKLYDYDTQCCDAPAPDTYEAQVLAFCKTILSQF